MVEAASGERGEALARRARRGSVGVGVVRGVVVSGDGAASLQRDEAKVDAGGEFTNAVDVRRQTLGGVDGPQTIADLPQVRDVHGAVVWRLRVARDELTCRMCGETFPKSWRCCPRCSGDEDGEDGRGMQRRTVAVETTSYLKEGEFEWV